jgi:hypothetical protein
MQQMKKEIPNWKTWADGDLPEKELVALTKKGVSLVRLPSSVTARNSTSVLFYFIFSDFSTGQETS